MPPETQGAVDGADIVVLATSSPTPVIDPAWVAPGAFITTVGPKQVGRAEFGPELVAACDLAVTDSVAQISAYDPPNILIGTPHEHRLTSLGAVLAGDATGRTGEEQRLLFCSVGSPEPRRSCSTGCSATAAPRTAAALRSQSPSGSSVLFSRPQERSDSVRERRRAVTRAD